MSEPSHQEILDKIDSLKTDVTDRMARVEVTLVDVKEKTKENSDTVSELKEQFSSNKGAVKATFTIGSALVAIGGLIIASIKYFG